jgi:hypothetical protein
MPRFGRSPDKITNWNIVSWRVGSIGGEPLAASLGRSVARRPRETGPRNKEKYMANVNYPVPGRTEIRNRQIAGHEIGHALITRALGDTVWSVSIIREDGPCGHEGRCIRSGAPSALTLSADDEVMERDEILTTCERLERLTPILGSARSDSAEYYVRSQNNVIALVAGECAEKLLHPDLPSLGAIHDFVEAAAFARIAVAASPAVEALVAYCRAEATALLTDNRDMVDALVEALIEAGELNGERVDEIISECVTARSAEIERQRRDDWREREASAAALDCTQV